MPTPSIQTLVTDAQQVLNLDSISAVRSVVAVALANANTGTPLNPNLTTQQLWNEFYQVVTKPKSDIESIIANQLMKFLYDPPAPGGVAGSGRVIFNKNGQLTTDPSFTWDDVLNGLTIGGNARTGSGAVGSPAHSFGSDTNTGAYNPGPDIWAVATNGVERFRIDALGNITASGTFTALGGENASAIRAAASDYAAVTFDGATASTRITSTLTGQNIGTGDFSLWSRFRVPATTPSNQPVVIALSDSGLSAGTDSAYLSFENADLRFTKFGASGSDARRATISGVVTAYAGQVVDIVVTRTGTTLKIYINGTDTTYTETTTGTPPAWSSSVNSSFVIVGARSSNTIFPGRIYRAVVFNRALSASDVTELITTGVNPADQWGTQTDIINATTLNGGFETAGSGGADVFADWVEATAGTSTINRDTSIFYAGTASCRFDLDVTGSAVSISSATFARNKRYRVSCFARSTATNGRLAVNVGSTTFSPVGAVLDNASWQERVLEFVTESGGGSSFAISRFAGSTNGSIWLDNVTFTRIGAIVDLDFTVGAGYQATDRSTNALHGTLFNGVEFTQPKRVAVLYATTTASGNTQLLGSLALPTNAIIEDIIVNSTGSATVSIGNVSAGTQIVNGAAVVSGRQKLTLAGISSTTGNLWVNSSAAVTLQFTILYTIAA